ncbi:MAG: arylsulfatase A-like enzyme [Myxococcota bacterium]|jgi:arylsulfatase A-like enzyme
MLALLGGACLASLIAMFLGGSEHSWRELALPILGGNLIIAFCLSIVLAPLARIPHAAWGQFSLIVCLVPALGSFGVAPTLLILIALSVLLVMVLKCNDKPKVPAKINYALLITAFAISFFGSYQNHLHLKRLNSATAAPKLASTENTGLVAPDIILVSLDTLRADSIVGERNPDYRLPFFDGMRAAGQWWDYAYSSSNQTLPGHASMLSGKDALASGVRYNFNQLPKPDKLHLISEYFKNAKYQTAGVISNALIAGDMGFRRGFDLYDDSTAPNFGPRTACENYLSQHTWLGIFIPSKIISGVLSKTSFRALQRPPRGMGEFSMRERGKVTNQQATDALSQLYKSKQPLFFFLHYIDVHHPYGAPAPFTGQLSSQLPPLAARYQPTAKLDGMITFDQLNLIRDDLKSSDAQVHDDAVAAAAYYHQLYLENLLFLDTQLEEIRKYVEASGRPTLWLITADHGEHFAENDALLHGNHMYQDSIRVPFIIAGPHIGSGMHRQGIPDLADVTPTLLDYAGIKIPAQMNGRSLLGDEDLRDKLHVVTDDVRLMLRMGDYKLIAIRDGENIVATHIFNLADDPDELNDLLGKTGMQLELLDALNEELLRDTFEDGGGTLTAEQNAALDELGYADGH